MNSVLRFTVNLDSYLLELCRSIGIWPRYKYIYIRVTMAHIVICTVLSPIASYFF